MPAPMVKNLSELVKTCNMPWMRYFIKYDPTESIKAARCPVMAVNGEKDTQIAAETNLNAIKNLLPDNSANAIKEYPGLNHLFQQCTTGNVNEYSQIEQTISPEVLKDITGWINKVK